MGNKINQETSETPLAEEAEESLEAPGVTEEPPPKAEIYDLHIKVDEAYRGKLKDAAELACELGDIEKPELASLMSLFIQWGLTVLKQKWLNRMGFK